MEHFLHIPEEEKNNLFFKMPEYFDRNTPLETLSIALGATLYIPAVHPKLLTYLMTSKYKALTSLVICLEDGIADKEVQQAEERVIHTFLQLQQGINAGSLKKERLPLLFIRTRSTQQLKKLLKERCITQWVTGFSLPKFNSIEGAVQLQLIQEASNVIGEKLYAMPILETRQIMDLTTRVEELIGIKKILDPFKEMILNIRIGATDFSSIYGIRRNMNTTIYDINVLRDCITAIINLFGKEDEYTISGPVWEFFNHHNCLLKPELRQRPQLLARAEEGLLKEIILDKVNGLCGKTVIHPSHITYVNALFTVTKEEYEDAKQILETTHCGVIKSKQANKMNEIKPHTYWAKKIIRRAKIYGVINDGEDYTSLF